MKHQDRLYAKSRRIVEQFKFNDDVADVFEDMVTRSVPGYLLMLDLLGVVAEKMIPENSLCYDLGCSLGASTLAIRHNISKPNCKITAIDNSEAMTSRCKLLLKQDKSATPTQVITENILDYEFEPCQFIAMNLILMFVPESKRNALIARLFKQLSPRGALFISEKIAFSDNKEQEFINSLHHQFKIHQGYSQLEVAQKREAIENFLVPESFQTHKDRLHDAGFCEVYMLLQSFNFISFIAIK